MKRALRLVALSIQILLFLTLNCENVSAQSCTSGWLYRMPISITHPTGLTNYQVKVTVNTSALISAGKMQATGADIRFYDASCASLPYWIENNTINTATTVIWVKVPTVASGTSDINMYYGNSTALAASNGTATFDFFDDFNNLSAWSNCHGSASFSIITNAGGLPGSYAAYTGNNCSGLGDAAIANTSYVMTNAIVETRFYSNTTGAGSCSKILAGINFRGNGCTNPAFRAAAGKAGYAYSLTTTANPASTGNLTLSGTSSATNLTTNTWYRFRVTANGSNYTFNYDEGPLSPSSVSAFSNTLPSGSLALSAAQPAAFDWVFARQYAASVPVLASGSEVALLQGPANVNTGIRLWLDGSNVNNTTPATNPTNGTGVTTWKDISGNGYDATVLSGQSAAVINTGAIGGQDALTFTRFNDGAGSVYIVDSVDIRSATMPQTTNFTVYRQGARTSAQLQGIWGNDNGFWDRFFLPAAGLLFGGDVTKGLVSVSPTGTQYVEVPNAGELGKIQLLTSVYDHGVTNGSTIYFNAQPVQTVTDNTDPLDAQPNLRIGWDGDNNPFNGDIAEMIIYDRKLTDCEIKAVNRYLGYKYGVNLTTSTISPAGTTGYCSGSSVTLTASAGTTYKWLKNGNIISGATNSTYAANSIGDYRVVVSNASGCADTSLATTVIQYANPTVSILNNIPFCAGDSITISLKDYSDTTATLNAGNGAGAIAACNCPQGYVAVGYTAKTGAIIDQWKLGCRRLVNGILDTAVVYTNINGNNSGATQQGPYLFSGNTAMVGDSLTADNGLIGAMTGFGQDIGYIAANGSNTSTATRTSLTRVSGSGWTAQTPLGNLNAADGSVITGMNGNSNTYSARVAFRTTPLSELINHYQWSTGDTTQSIVVKNFNTYNVTITNGLGCSATGNVTTGALPSYTVYVDSAVTTSGTGYSWASPLKTVSEALNVANTTTCINQVLVKKGTYYPMAGTVVSTSRDSSFRIKRNGIKVYGGFGGNDTTMATRNVSLYPTILSGDIGTANDSTDNVYHVMTITITGTIDTSTRLDGLTITKGTGGASGSGAMTLNTLGVNRQDGGGLYLGAGANSTCSPQIVNCTISGNGANFGGGMYANSGYSATATVRPLITNCTFIRNRAVSSGGAMFLQAQSGDMRIAITGTTISFNSAVGNGGAIYSNRDSGTYNNCIFTSNSSAGSGGSIFGNIDRLIFNSCQFNSNAAVNGGAVSSNSDTVKYTNCTLNGNTVTTGVGAGAANYNSYIEFNNTTVSNNTNGSGDGGGLYSQGTSKIYLKTSRFLNNSAHYGGGVVNVNGAMSVRECVFSGNSSTVGGGGIHCNLNASDTVINSVFVGNTSVTGGAIHHAANAEQLIINNSTFYNNTGTARGGGLYFESNIANGNISNNIFWGNTSPSGPGIGKGGSGTLTVAYSDVQSGYAGTGNIASNPLFKNSTSPIGADNAWATADDGLTLVTTGGAVNAGDNTVVTTTTDIIGATRIQGSTVDMGAYESSFTCGSGIVYVDSSKATSGDGTSWATAFKTVTEGLAIANRCPLVTQVWVAKGTYYSMEGTAMTTNRDSSFRILRNGIKMYGGFAGNESLLSARNITANPTTLSGDIGVANDSTDNSYHVMTIIAVAGSNIDTTTTVNGFTFTGSNGNVGGGYTIAGISAVRTDGGGILNVSNSAGTSSSALIENCTFLRNYANVGGGMYCGGYTGGTSNPVVRNCNFTGNGALDVGGLHSYTDNGSAAPTVSNCVFTNNRSSSNGGAMGSYRLGTGVASPRVTNCIFSSNTSTGPGGAINIYGGSFTITNCVFVNNTSTAASGSGGGVIHVPGGGSVTFNNTTLHNNTTASSTLPNANAIAADGGSVINLNNTIIWGSAAQQIDGTGTVNYSYSDVRGITPTATNLSVDPYFVNAANAIGADSKWGTSDDGLRLTSCSPLLNAGSNALIPAGITTDIANAARIQQITVDMGAYESVSLPIAINKNHTNVLCRGNATGTATVAVSGGLGSYTYSWSPSGGNAATATGLAAGIYTVTVTDVAGGCQVTSTDTITEPATAITTSISSSTDVVCFGNATGAATVLASGGTGTLTYSWNTTPVQTTATAIGLVAGTYIVTVTDANLCTKTQNVTINQPSTGLTATTTKTNALCFGAANGTATAVPAGGTGTYTYSWNTTPVQTTITATGLAAGTYTVTVKDAGNCTATATATITQPAAAITLTPTQTNVLCFGAATGSATVVAAGGSIPYTYSWTGSASTTATASGLTAGTYVVTVKDANLCQTTQSYTITQPTTAVSASIATPTPVSCFGGTNGAATATGSGGVGTYTYSWNTSPVQTTATAANLPAGTYTVTVKDANLCQATQSVTITQPAAALAAIATAPARVCAGTALNITSSVSGGTIPYTYSWTGPNSYTSTGANPTFPTARVSMSGTYNLTVTDARSCTTTASATTAVDTIAQQPGNISGTAAVCGNSVTTYSVTAVATATSYAWVLPTTPTGWAGTSTTTSIAATSPNTAGTGTISVAAVNGCGTSLARTMTVTVSTTPLQPGIIAGDATVCGGISKLYSVTPVAQATTYTWTVPTGWSAPSPSSTGSFINSTPPTATGTGNGTISVSASNSCGVSSARTLAVTVTNIPAQPAAISGLSPVCGGTAQIYKIPKVTEATGYTWTVVGNGWTSAAGSPTDTFVNATAGTADIVISVAASNFCGTGTARTLAVVVANRPGSAGIISGPDSVCKGAGAVTYTTGQINEATSYNWTLPSGWSGTSTTTSMAGTPGATAAIGTVTISVAGVNACGTGPSATKNITVNNPVTPSVSLTSSSTGTVCAGSPITFTAVGLNTGAAPLYQWKVNGVNSGVASGANTFTTSTLNTGDVVSVVMKTSLPCATTAGGLVSASTPAQTIRPRIMPGVNINATTPPDLCKDAAVTFYSNVTGGGASPTYQWWKNGSPIAGATGVNYTTNTLNNGDTLRVVLTSNEACRLVDTISSNKMGVSVSPFVTPVVSISANPGTVIGSGQTVIFTAAIANGGANPEVRWKRNGQTVAGTTGLTWTTTTLRNGDAISAELVSGARCATPFLVVSQNTLTISISTGIGNIVSSSIGNISLYPNPTTGKFTVMVKGGNNVNGKQIKLDVLNAVGQVVYKSAVRPDTKDWSLDVRLDDNVANGIYMLRIALDDEGGNLQNAKEQASVIRFELRR